MDKTLLVVLLRDARDRGPLELPERERVAADVLYWGPLRRLTVQQAS